MSPRRTPEPEPDEPIEDEPDTDEPTDEADEIDLDALIDERVKAALDSVKDSAPDGEGGTDDTGGGEARPEGRTDSGADRAPLAGDSGDIEAKVAKVLDKRRADETLEERLQRLENPEAPEPRKRKGLAKVLLGDGWSFKR